MRSILIIALTVLVAAGFASCSSNDGHGDQSAKALFDEAPRVESEELKAAREMLRSGVKHETPIIDEPLPVGTDLAVPAEPSQAATSKSERHLREDAMLKKMQLAEQRRRAAPGDKPNRRAVGVDDEG